MALAAKSPWYHSTGNRDDGFESSSSASLLHSIYGSQASQLLFSSSGYGSESSMPPPPAAGSMEQIPAGHMASTQRTRPQRHIRPKSSPVSGIVSRAERRSQQHMEVELSVRKTPVEQYKLETAQHADRTSEVHSPASSGEAIVATKGRSRKSISTRRPASAAVTSQRRPSSASQFGAQKRSALSRPRTALGIVSWPKRGFYRLI